jgi:hypothetical protein
MRAVVALLSVLACLWAFVPAAGAAIVVGVSVAGVKLGDSVATVKRKLGPPSSVLGRNKVFNYKRRKLTIAFNKGKATELVTSSSRERTAKGVGPGSTLAAVGQAYPGSCYRGIPHCAIALGHTSTQFDAGTAADQRRVQTVKVQKLLTHGEIG